jgi:hypothetical protein
MSQIGMDDPRAYEMLMLTSYEVLEQKSGSKTHICKEHLDCEEMKFSWVGFQRKRTLVMWLMILKGSIRIGIVMIDNVFVSREMVRWAVVWTVLDASVE